MRNKLRIAGLALGWLLEIEYVIMIATLDVDHTIDSFLDYHLMLLWLVCTLMLVFATSRELGKKL